MYMYMYVTSSLHETLPSPRSSLLISLFICDFALMCSSCALFAGLPLSVVVVCTGV